MKESYFNNCSIPNIVVIAVFIIFASYLYDFGGIHVIFMFMIVAILILQLMATDMKLLIDDDKIVAINAFRKKKIALNSITNIRKNIGRASGNGEIVISYVEDSGYASNINFCYSDALYNALKLKAGISQDA
jgi:hypothetical protein